MRSRDVARPLQIKHLKGSNLLQKETILIISVSFLTSNFLFLKMSYYKWHCWWSIKHTRPSFGQQDIHNGKWTSVRDLCSSESGYPTHEKGNSSLTVTWLVHFVEVWVSQTCKFAVVISIGQKTKTKKTKER